MSCNGNPLHVGGPDGSYPIAPPAVGECNEGLTDDELLAAANLAQEITVDGQTVVRRPLSDLIALNSHLQNKCVGSQWSGNAWGAVAKAKAVPPSAIGDQ